ncbi:MAG: penicillin-binding protein 2 [Deltaproteobacteria bacterium]|nr:penicillin-binding protein 2 [Deltaproteobacteria bacterium]
MTRRGAAAGDPLAVGRRRRIIVVTVFALLAYGGLFARAVQLQALDASWLARRAELQRNGTLALGALRGPIVDRAGAPLALSAWVQSVSASPRLVDDRLATSRALGRALGIPAARVGAQLEPSRGFAWIARWVTPEQAERVRALDLAGVRLHPERKRFYPNRALAAAYLGFAGRDGNGLSGIELAFDESLRGTPTRLAVQRDGHGRRLMTTSGQTRERRGARLVLALDVKLQQLAEEALEHALESTQARHLSLVALDPRNGDVLALAEAPGFDPNRFWEANPGAFRTRSFVDAFEPGSTLKPFTLALALEAGVVRESDEFDCENGSWQVHDRVIRDWRPHGVLDVRDILAMSSNIGAAKVANRLGSQRLVSGLRRLGFGERTGSRFPGEAAGILRPLREAQSVERANLAFGQGLTVTTLQLAASGAVFANGGRRVHPRMALRLEDEHGVTEFPSGLGERVLPAEVADRVLRMMRRVVEHGTGASAAVPSLRVAGKTGTAQKVVDGRYSQEHYVASFLGIFPADAPRLVIAVVVDEPRRGAHTGGGAAAPIFRTVARRAARSLPADGAS